MHYLGLMECSDEEIKSALAEHENLRNIPINSATRSVLIRKITELKKRRGGTDATLELLEPLNVSRHDNPDEESSSPLVSGSKVYYAVALSEASYSKVEQLEKVKQVFKSKPDALEAMKHIPGSRCRIFDTEASAHEFKDNQVKQLRQCLNGTEATSAPSNGHTGKEKANSYPSLKTSDLNKFRKDIIEKGDVVSFRQAVCVNPNYLIAVGDTPEILQQSMRYNALHCAVKSGALEICSEILEMLESYDFWSQVYPKDSQEIRKRRSDHLLDLYLNTCEKGVRERNGHCCVECIYLLL